MEEIFLKNVLLTPNYATCQPRRQYCSHTLSAGPQIRYRMCLQHTKTLSHTSLLRWHKSELCGSWDKGGIKTSPVDGWTAPGPVAHCGAPLDSAIKGATMNGGNLFIWQRKWRPWSTSDFIASPFRSFVVCVLRFLPALLLFSPS
jgi:hypothetical protein